jgi:glycosyltransferase involved in cell wall biosynthesis
MHLVERRRGKSLALNTAIQHARGEIVAFTDDDCVVDPSWLRTVVREFEADPSLGGLGGRVELYDSADHIIGTRTQQHRQLYRPLERLALIFGCNMALSRQALRDTGEFDPWLGPGSRCRSGEDVDLLFRAHKMGVKIVYAPDLVVYHNHGRRTYRDVRASGRAYGVATGALYCKHIVRGDRDIARVAYRDLRATAKRSLRVLLGQQSFKPNDIRPHDLMTGMMLYGSQQAVRAMGLGARSAP